MAIVRASDAKKGVYGDNIQSEIVDEIIHDLTLIKTEEAVLGTPAQACRPRRGV